MREQSAWLPPATPPARREDAVGAERRGPAAAATAATSERRSCPRASERFPQPRPPLLTPPPQFAGSAATKGAGSRSPELVRSARSQGRRRARAPAAAGGDALPGAAAGAGPALAPGLPEGACGAGAPRRRAPLQPSDLVPALPARRCPSGLDG